MTPKHEVRAKPVAALIEDRFEDTLRIIGSDPPSVLLVRRADEWGFPVVETRGHHPANVWPTRQTIREQLGVDAFVLACREVEVGGGEVRRMLDAELLSLSDDGAPHDRRWTKLDAPTNVIDGRGWTRCGWWARANAWLARQAEAGGWVIRTVEQIRTWEFSCVLRVETDLGDLYFKALPRAYASEVALIQQLATWYPADVPGVVAADVRRRWVLLRACPGHCLEEGAPLLEWRRVARAYATLQVEAAARIHRRRALGCYDRSPTALRGALGPLLANNRALLVGQEHGLTSAEFQRLVAWLP